MFILAIVAYTLCSLMMVIIGYTIKDAVKFFREFDEAQFTPYEHDKELAGAWVILEGDDDTYYVSMGSWDDIGNCDDWGVPDERIFYYMDGHDLWLGDKIAGHVVRGIVEWVEL